MMHPPAPANDNVPGSIRFKVEPRYLPPVKAARILHLTEAEFEAARPALHRAGFPRPCPIIGNYDVRAIHAWIDNRSGLATTPLSPEAAYDVIMARLNG